VVPTLDDPLAPETSSVAGPGSSAPTAIGPYDRAMDAGGELRTRPFTAAGTLAVLRQHAKDRMTVWERIEVLQDRDTQPTVLYQNWGRNLDGASIVTAIVKIGGATSPSTATTSRSAPARWTRRTAASWPT
jgi:hypothetical protein